MGSIVVSEEEARILHITRKFVALRKCLDELNEFYYGLHNDTIPGVHLDKPHPRFYPCPTSYTDDKGCQVEFRYNRRLERDEPTCVTFLAEIISNDATQKVVVKFVARYGRIVHNYLAQKGHAPRLLYFGRLDGTMHAPTSDFDQFNGARHPDMGAMQMTVVMGYIDSKTTTPPNACEQIREILIDLHSAAYAFGDLGRLNILFNKTDKVSLVDINWCGRYDMSKNPKDKISQEGQEPRKKEGCVNENNVLCLFADRRVG
jgi:hypothetical protein